MKDKLIDLAREIQSISQIGLAYSKDVFDIERYERLREISAEIISMKSEINLDKVKDLFCNEKGYQTPKIGTRVAIFKEDKILLVQENDDRWTMPGGWCDIFESVGQSAIKEVREEAGFNIKLNKLVGVLDANKYNKAIHIYGICAVYFIGEVIDGKFNSNNETKGYNYFSLEELPELAIEKSSQEQIEMCFKAYKDDNWQAIFE